MNKLGDFLLFLLSFNIYLLLISFRMGIIEESALREIQSKFHSHRLPLEAEFRSLDPDGTGKLFSPIYVQI